MLQAVARSRKHDEEILYVLGAAAAVHISNTQQQRHGRVETC
jgi:hypothetical protein